MNRNYHVDLERLIDVISSIPSNIFYKDTDLKYVFSSHIWEQIDSGNDDNFDIYGKSDREVRKDTKNLDSAEKSDKEIIETGVGKRYTIKSEVDDHTQILDITKEPVRDKDGNVVGIVGIINDVSLIADELRKQFENNLREAERVAQLKSDFLANISHEIRTPLNGILGMNDMILREYDDPTLIEYATNIKQSGNILLGLINELLDFSKIESGKMEIISENYNYSDFIRDIISPIKLKAYKKFLSFKYEIDKDIPIELFGDAKRIGQILTNLLTNAVKYTEKGTVTLKVSLVEKDDFTCKVKYEVIDTGIGIKEEEIDNLTTSFVRLEDQRNKHLEGVGLGISISSNLLKQMDSKLEIESQYGEGSNFSFVLEQRIINKMTYGEYKEKKKKAENSNEAFVAPDAQVLIVDDVLVNLRVAEGLLGKLNMNIDTALSGKEAIDRCKDVKYDIVFMDYMMPEMNGTQTMQHIRKEIPGYKDVPIIALTANSMTEAKEELMGQGFNDFVPKPIDVQFITGIIRKWLPGELINFDPVEEHKENDKEEISKDENIHDDSFEKILKHFYDSIDGNSQKCRELLEEKQIEFFIGEIHKIGDEAKMIAAENLSNKAFEIESVCYENDIEKIKNEYEIFEKYYIEFKGKLELILKRKNIIE